MFILVVGGVHHSHGGFRLPTYCMLTGNDTYIQHDLIPLKSALLFTVLSL